MISILMKADWTSIMEKPLHHHEGCEEAVVHCPGSRPPINPKARKCTASSSAANWKDSAAELQVDGSTETPKKLCCHRCLQCLQCFQSFQCSTSSSWLKSQVPVTAALHPWKCPPHPWKCRPTLMFVSIVGVIQPPHPCLTCFIFESWRVDRFVLILFLSQQEEGESTRRRNMCQTNEPSDIIDFHCEEEICQSISG